MFLNIVLWYLGIGLTWTAVWTLITAAKKGLHGDAGLAYATIALLPWIPFLMILDLLFGPDI